MAKYMELTFKDQNLQECQEIFNEICTNHPEEFLEFGPYDLYLKSQRRIPITTWKKFMLDEQVANWYNDEQVINMRRKANKMMKELGTDTSMARTTGLTALLQQLSKQNNNKPPTDIIVYNFIPLTPEERKNPNVNIVENVPNQIRNAIQNIRAISNNKKE